MAAVVRPCQTSVDFWLLSRTFLEGVFKYDGKEFTQFTIQNGLVNDSVFSILQDKEENLWFGTIDGPCRYNGKSIISVFNSCGYRLDIFQIPFLHKALNVSSYGSAGSVRTLSLIRLQRF
jgi:hypothetical protein